MIASDRNKITWKIRTINFMLEFLRIIIIFMRILLLGVEVDVLRHIVPNTNILDPIRSISEWNKELKSVDLLKFVLLQIPKGIVMMFGLAGKLF